MITRGASVLARALNMLRRLASRIQPYADIILILTTGTLLLIGLYTGQIPVVTTPPPEQPHLVPPIVERIVTLAMEFVSLTMIFLILRQRWDCQTQPIGMRIGANIRLGIVKCLAILTMAVSLSSGLDLLIKSLQLRSTATSLDFAAVAAFLAALYGPTTSFDVLHDVVTGTIVALLSVAIAVSVFVTVPAVSPPLLQMILIAVAATILDGLLSLIPMNWNRIASMMARYA